MDDGRGVSSKPFCRWLSFRLSPSFWDVSSTFQDCLHLPALVMPLLSLGAVAYSCYSEGIPLFMDGNCVICLSKLNPAPAKILSCGHVPWYFKDISGETHEFQDGDLDSWISLSNPSQFPSFQHSKPYTQTGGWKVLECSFTLFTKFSRLTHTRVFSRAERLTSRRTLVFTTPGLPQYVLIGPTGRDQENHRKSTYIFQ